MITDTDDYLELSNSDDILLDAKEGNDTINALDGDDTLSGGRGDDTLSGGKGNDTYIYNLGDGNDTIEDISGVDTLRFGEDITIESLEAQTIGNDIVITIKNSSKITIKGGALSGSAIENIELYDSTVVNLDQIQRATTGDDIFVFGNSSATIDALAGNDTITTGDADDTIALGLGDDVARSGAGDDTISGGKGDDILYGGAGDDTYLYSKGDGTDTIIDEYKSGYKNQYTKDAGNDTIIFDNTIKEDDLLIELIGEDLVITIKDETTDKITLTNWTNSDSRVA